MYEVMIYTESGGDHGMGHAVRMANLAKEMIGQGADVTMLADPSPGLEYFNREGLPILETGIGVARDAKYFIVDVAETNDDMLADIRGMADILIVIVGTGWTITPMTRKLADLIVYQGVGEPTKEVLQSSGGEVLYGLEWLVLHKNYERDSGFMGYPDDGSVFCYLGGGIPTEYKNAVYDNLDLYFDKLVVGFPPKYFRTTVYKQQARCAVQVSTFGMVAYEALTLRKPVVSFSRSADHESTAQKLKGIDSLGLFYETTPAKIATAAVLASETIYNDMHEELLDGHGALRLASHILWEL